MTKVYIYSGCDGCRRAKLWLQERGIEFEAVAIREQPPTRDELRLALSGAERNLRRLFNVSGEGYRRLNLKETLKGMGDEQALAELEQNGNLVKRPFLVTAAGACAGFDEGRWSALLEKAAEV